VAAVEALLNGHTNILVGVVDGKVKLTPIAEVWSRRKEIDQGELELARVVS
jgi:6-phosphofructokinase 1